MIVETRDAKVEFPASMSNDDIHSVLRKTYGFEPPPTFDDSTFGGRLAHLWQNTKDEARVAGNTFGLYDRMMADQTGFAPDASGRWVQGGTITDLDAANAAALKAERAKTAAASERIGPIDTALMNAAGYGPLLAAGGSGIVGGTAVGAGLGATAAYGRGEDPGRGALV